MTEDEVLIVLDYTHAGFGSPPGYWPARDGDLEKYEHCGCHKMFVITRIELAGLDRLHRVLLAAETEFCEALRAIEVQGER